MVLNQVGRVESGKLAEPLDPRGTQSLASMIAHLKGGGMKEKEAFTTALKSVMAKIARPDPIYGLPDMQDQQVLDQKIKALALPLP